MAVREERGRTNTQSHGNFLRQGCGVAGVGGEPCVQLSCYNTSTERALTVGQAPDIISCLHHDSTGQNAVLWVGKLRLEGTRNLPKITQLPCGRAKT